MTRVRYVEVGGLASESIVQALLDQMWQEGFELFEVISNIDDRRGNPSVTAGLYLFFKQQVAESVALAA